jgi:N-carbamoyl-L-amino-acid hydrolase
LKNLPLSGARLWADLHDIARIGATPAGGCDRQALTDLDAQARDWLRVRAEALGCRLLLDRFGNMGFLRPGRDPARQPVGFGSHLDTQPTGGKYDGVLGVLAGLEILRALHEAGAETEAPLLLLNWTNEEGARFSPPMQGSGAALGIFAADAVLESRDAEGAVFGAELARIGWQGSDTLPELAAFLELHIEQGTELEAAGVPVGVVTHALAQRWYEVTVEGVATHAGSRMEGRRDALVAALPVMAAVDRIARDHGGMGTIGQLRIEPGSRNVAPERVWFSVDTRHADEAALDSMGAALRAGAAGLGEVRDFWHSPGLCFDPTLVAHLREAAAARGLPWREMPTVIGHDAVHLARQVPTAMVFVPCHGGVSHNPAESITPEWAEAGLLVLAGAVLAAAGPS